MRRVSLAAGLAVLAACELEPTGQGGVQQTTAPTAGILAPGYTFVDLGVNNDPIDMNNVPQVIGDIEVAGAGVFLWENGVLSEMPPAAGDVSAGFERISETGVAVGAGVDALSTLRPVMWQGGVTQALGVLPEPYTLGVADAVSDNGQYVVGTL